MEFRTSRPTTGAGRTDGAMNGTGERAIRTGTPSRLRAGSAAAMGFGYEQLRALNPSIVMLSSCMMGQNGPWRDFAGFGNLAAAVAALPGRRIIYTNADGA